MQSILKILLFSNQKCLGCFWLKYFLFSGVYKLLRLWKNIFFCLIPISRVDDVDWELIVPDILNTFWNKILFLEPFISAHSHGPKHHACFWWTIGLDLIRQGRKQASNVCGSIFLNSFRNNYKNKFDILILKLTKNKKRGEVSEQKKFYVLRQFRFRSYKNVTWKLLNY